MVRSSAVRVLSLIMLVVILFASNGLVVLVHKCRTSHEVQVSLFHRSGCCSDRPCAPTHSDSKEDAIKGQCCELRADFLKVELCSSGQQALTAFDHVALPAFIVREAEVVCFSSAEQLSTCASPPLNAASPDLLLRLHQLLI